jgi:hypothetical protein
LPSWTRQAYAEDLVAVADSPVPVTGKLPRFMYGMRPTRSFVRATALPLLLRGPCLKPWFTEGDVVWFDPTLDPRDCDIVAFEIYYECTIDGERRCVQQKSVKQFRILDGAPFTSRRFLVCDEGYLDATDIKLLGPVTAWHRPKWWRRPAVRHLDFDLPVKVFDYSKRMSPTDRG